MGNLIGGLILFLMFCYPIWWIIKRQAETKAKKEADEKARREYEIYQRQEKARREEERLKQEEQHQKRQEEYNRRIAERDAAYKKMVDGIQPVPISVSEEKSKKIAISFLNTLKYSTITVRSNMEVLSNYVVIDTETTGLKCVSDEIIEIAAIRFRGFQPVEKFTTLLAPSKLIPDRITEINHITNEMVADKPCFQQIAPALMEFIGNDNLVGHNLPFDLKFIVHYGANVTVIPRKYYDTLDLARKTVRGLDNYKLLTVCASLGIPGATYKTLHRAEADALATGLLYQKIIDLRMDRK